MFGVKTGGFGSAEARDAYFDGVHDGLRLFAWNQDGTQMVGTTGTTLAAAEEEVDMAQKEAANAVPERAKPEDKPKPDHTLPKPEGPKPEHPIAAPPRGKPEPEPEPEPKRGTRR